MGVTVVMVCRNPEKGKAALEEIKLQSGNESVDLMIADLSSQESIYQLAEEFKRKYQNLHVLINNAGLILGKRTLTEDNIEYTFAVNHLGYFLLTHLLLEVLKTSAPSRIINVASEAHRRSPIKFNDLQNEKKYKSFDVYGQTKLANILFTYELTKRLEGTGVTVNCLHPGVVRTNFGNAAELTFRIMFKMLSPFMISPKNGAETAIYLASSPEVEGITGKYFIKKKETSSNLQSYNKEDAKKLWEISETFTGLNDSPV